MMKVPFGGPAIQALRTDRRLVVALGIIVALSLVIRLGAVKATTFHPETDAADYDRHAVSLLRHHRYPASEVTDGHGATAFRPPAFPYMLAGVYVLSGTANAGRRWQAGRVVEAGLGALSVGLIALVALALAGPAVALTAAALSAVYPPLVAINTSLLSESLYLPLELGALACVLAHRRSPHPRRWLVAGGVLAGLLALTRSNGALLVLALAVGVWAPPRRSLGALAAPAVLLATALVVIAPWTARNAAAMHAFVPISTQAGFGLAGQFNDVSRADNRFPAGWRPPPQVPKYAPLIHRRDLSEAEVDSRLRSAAQRFIAHDPGYVAKAGYWNTLRLFNIDSRGIEGVAARDLGISQRFVNPEMYALYAIALLALAGSATTAARRVPRFVWLLPFFVVLSAMFITGETRYRVPADPFLILLASMALVSMARRVTARARIAPAT